MSLWKIIILAMVQGLAELLPVSSSAHVVVAEKLLGLDPSSPPMTLLLVMPHTGTMFAVIVYFWQQWRSTYFQSARAFQSFAGLLIVIAGIFEKRHPTQTLSETNDLNMRKAALIGAIQGLCLPFRGFSRSGATISTGMLL